MLGSVIMFRKSFCDQILICEQGSRAFYELEEFTLDYSGLFFVRLNLSKMMSGCVPY